LLNGASVRPAITRSAFTTSAALRAILTGQELVEAHQQLHVGIGRLRDLCNDCQLPRYSEIMFASRGQQIASAMRRLDGGNTYCGARLEHDAGQDRYPFCLETEGVVLWVSRASA
jgi:hypothetical protein